MSRSSSLGSRPSFNTSRKLSRENRKGRCNDHHSLHEKRQRSRHDNTEAEKAARSIFGDVPLTDTERRYLWSAQSGNLPALEVLVEDAGSFNLCCRDYLGRTALQLSLLGEHYDCIQLLLNKLRPHVIQEGLLHAIKANNVKICDMFLSHPLYSDPRARMQFQLDHQNGLFEQEDSSSSFANDITPIVLAAQCNNFDIVHMLIQKGFTISTPHNYFCLCPLCQTFKDQDRVVHSKSRLNAYRGLASTAYLSLSCDDPIYAAFELSRNLEKLAEREKEHKNEYRGLSNQCKDFAVALLDQCRTNDEVMSALHGGTDTTDLARIKMAIRYDQKKFIAHASCQEQLASMWYSGAPWFQHQSFVIKLLMIPFGIAFIPLTAIVYVFVPYSKLGRILKSPFMKFMNYICSYMAFLVLLFLGTQLTSFQSVHLFNGVEGVVNSLIMFYVLGMFWAECKQLWEEGLHDYFSQMWNYMDITMLALYTAGYSIEGVIYTKANGMMVPDNHLLHGKDKAILNPQILSKILFSVANVMSFARIAYILPASETFGQLQISYGRMLQDVGKFIFIYVTVMVAFICGLTSLYSISNNTSFSGISETTGTLFWAAFGLGNSKAPQIGSSDHHSIGTNVGSGGSGGRRTGGRSGVGGSGGGGMSSGGGVHNGVHVSGSDGAGGNADRMTDAEMLEVVQMVGYILYGVYILGAVVVLINMLIAMMSNTFEEIQKSEDCEWKFARAKLWISFIEQGTTLPIPFNIIPTPKSIVRLTRVIKNSLRCRQGKFDPSFEDSQKVALEYKAIMHRVVLRYIHKMKFENREESLKDEILDTKEEVLYQMHSMMSRLSYRMEMIENDVLVVSKNLQNAPPQSPTRSNLSYSRSVPSNVRNAISGKASSVPPQEKRLAPVMSYLRRGRSYFHNRPKHKLSDHSIRYSSHEPPNLGNLVPSTTTTTTTTTNSSSSSSNLIPHTRRSLSDSGEQRSAHHDDDTDIINGILSRQASYNKNTPSQLGSSSRMSIGSGSLHHCGQGQESCQGQGYLPYIDVTSSSGITKTLSDNEAISTISGHCRTDSPPYDHTSDEGHQDLDVQHRRVDSLRLRGSYSPRPGEDRQKLSDASRKHEGISSNPLWGGQHMVIEESWLEDHPTPVRDNPVDMAHPTALNPLSVNTSHHSYGSVRRRRETRNHPNIDAPFQPISTADHSNNFTEYRYSKPKRRETIQNLILDVNNVSLPGIDIVKGSEDRAPAGSGNSGSHGESTSNNRTTPRKTSGNLGQTNPAFSGCSLMECTPTMPTPRSADESRHPPFFNWSQPFQTFCGRHSQENLYYPMQVIQQESVGSEDSNSTVTGNTNRSVKNDTGGLTHDDTNNQKSNNSSGPNKNYNSSNNWTFRHHDRENESDVSNLGTKSTTYTGTVLNETRIQEHSSSQSNRNHNGAISASDESHDPLSSSYRDGTTSHVNDKNTQPRTMSPLTLAETEVPSTTPTRRPVRKLGVANLPNINPIVLGERSFFHSLWKGDNDSCNSARREVNRQESAESTASNPERESSYITGEHSTYNYSPTSQSDVDNYSKDEGRRHCYNKLGHEETMAPMGAKNTNSTDLDKSVYYQHQQQQQQQHQQQQQLQQQQRQHQKQQSPNVRRQKLLQQQHFTTPKDSHLRVDRNEKGEKVDGTTDTQTSPYDETEPEIQNSGFLSHQDFHSSRHFSDSFLVPYHHHKHHHQNHHGSHGMYHHNNHNHRQQVFPAITTVGDQQRSSMSNNTPLHFASTESLPHHDDEDITNIMPRVPNRFSDACDELEPDMGIANDHLYIPPMASNLIPFSVVPNTTPVHHYTTHRAPDTSEQDEEKTIGCDVTEREQRKRKTSSGGKKLSLAMLVRGRRSDKGKGKQPEIHHNRSLSLNRFGSRGDRLKQLQPQRSKEV